MVFHVFLESLEDAACLAFEHSGGRVERYNFIHFLERENDLLAEWNGSAYKASVTSLRNQRE